MLVVAVIVSYSPSEINILFCVSIPLLQIGQAELIALEKGLKAAMHPAGTAREVKA